MTPEAYYERLQYLRLELEKLQARRDECRLPFRLRQAKAGEVTLGKVVYLALPDGKVNFVRVERLYLADPTRKNFMGDDLDIRGINEAMFPLWD